jgi:hypothetical protein
LEDEMDFFIETRLWRDLSFFFLATGLFSFFWLKAEGKLYNELKEKLLNKFTELKAQKIEEEIKRWWEGSNEEKDFVKKFEIFLKIYPTQKTRKSKRKTRIYLKKIQEILQKQYLREEIISGETFEELLDLIEEKRKELLSK